MAESSNTRLPSDFVPLLLDILSEKYWHASYPFLLGSWAPLGPTVKAATTKLDNFADEALPSPGTYRRYIHVHLKHRHVVLVQNKTMHP